MPQGVEVVVADGFATIDFVDQALRGPGLTRLLEVGGPEFVEKLTRGHGPRAVYRVPEGNAREAGLLDSVDNEGDDLHLEPSEQWSRAELNDAAADVGVASPEKLANKGAVLDAYRRAKAAQSSD